MRALPLALLACLALLVPAASADWASFHGNALNTGSVDSQYPLYKEVLWSEKGASDKQVLASPVLKDGRLIVADRGGHVRALDAQSGFEFWSYKMPASVEGTPAVSADHVYVADIAGNLRSINLFDGRMEFQTTVGKTAGNIAEHEGKIFIGTEAGEMKAYLADLTLLWTFKAGDWFSGVTCVPQTSGECKNQCVDEMANQPIRGKPAIYSGYVYFGSLNHHLYAVLEGGLGNLKTSLKWWNKTGDVIVGAPVIANGKVVVGAYDGKVYSFDAKPATGVTDGPFPCPGSARDSYARKATPNTGWPFHIPDSNNQITKIYSSPAYAGGKIFIGANNGHVYAIYANNGTQAWVNKDTGSDITPVKSSPAVANNIVVVGSDNKNVFWLSAQDGRELAKFPAQAAVPASPAIEGKLAFVASMDGTWYAFSDEKPKRPDLIVTDLNPTATKVTTTMRNQGEADSNATTLRVRVNGGLLFDVAVPPLAVGKDVTIAHANFTPIPRGKAVVSAFIDPFNAVIEGDESNNDHNETATIGATPRPNTSAPSVETTTGGGKIPSPTLAVPFALAGAALLLRRRIR